MKVKELIMLLELQNPEAIVFCEGEEDGFSGPLFEANGVTLQPNGSVLIETI